MARAQGNPLSRWEEIASFYAGRPIRIEEDTRGAMQATGGYGTVKLGSQLLKSLQEWDKNVKLGKQGKAGPKKASAQNRAVVLGALALSTLLHEAVHNRDFGAVQAPGVDEDDWRNPTTGFYAAGNEPQAALLGSQLLPDMMQRYFGLGAKTPFSQRLLKSGTNLSNYVGALGSAQWGGQVPQDYATRYLRAYLGMP